MEHRVGGVSQTQHQRLAYNNLSVLDAFSSVKSYLAQAQKNQEELAQAVDMLPCNGKSGVNFMCYKNYLQSHFHHQYFVLSSQEKVKIFWGGVGRSGFQLFLNKGFIKSTS